MKVLALVTDGFGGHGGIALYVRNLLHALCRHESRPRVTAIPRIVPKPVEAMPDNLDFRVHAKGSKIRYAAEVIRMLATRPKWDLVLATHLNLLPLAVLAKRYCSSPLILMLYGFEANPRQEWLLRPLLKDVDACVSIRERTTERLRGWADLSNTKCYILPNAIHLNAYGRAPRRADLVERFGLANRTVLMTLGRMDDRHFGEDEIFGVLPELAEKVPNLTYLVVGGGKALGALKAHAKELGLQDLVVFTGAVSDTDKADYYRLADAFAMPGTDPVGFDTYPLRFTFLEAMACGLPVVATRPEELDDLSQSPIPNIYVDPHDSENLLSGLVEGLRRGPGEVPEQLRRFDYPSFQERLHVIVDEVMERHSGRNS